MKKHLKKIVIGLMLGMATLQMVGCASSTCKESGCSQPVYKDGYCKQHYIDHEAETAAGAAGNAIKGLLDK